MSAFAILGSGFGLYGYLPALVACNQSIFLPERYRLRFNARSELAPFAENIEWAIDEVTALRDASGVVLALSPDLQEKWIEYCLALPRMDCLLLEKPLAQSPENAAILLDRLIASQKKFRIGYIFRYTHWGKKLRSLLKEKCNVTKISIRWSFLADHFQKNINTWKRFHVAGGGVVRFYGIHLIALLAEMGYTDVIASESVSESGDEYSVWNATFSGNGLPECKVIVDSHSSANRFKVIADTIQIADLQNPFDLKHDGLLDQRVPVMNELVCSLQEVDITIYKWYLKSIKLWALVEHKTLWKDNEEKSH